jgi:hypothetical protein
MVSSIRLLVAVFSTVSSILIQYYLICFKIKSILRNVLVLAGEPALCAGSNMGYCFITGFTMY